MKSAIFAAIFVGVFFCGHSTLAQTGDAVGTSPTAPALGKEAVQAYFQKKPKAKKSSKKPVVVKEVNYRSEAEKELVVSQKEQTATVLPTPATVRSRIEKVSSPISFTAMQMGLSVQPYQPVGTSAVSGLQPYDLGGLGTRPMGALDLRWLPFEPTTGLLLGGFGSIGYTNHVVSLRTPTGEELKDTKVHTVKSVLGAAVEYHFARSQRWSVAGLVGAGRLDSVQSGSSSRANESKNLTFLNLGTALQNRLTERLTAYGQYDYRSPLAGDSTLGIQKHNFMVGFLGSFH